MCVVVYHRLVQVVDRKYQKIPDLSAENWVWSPQGEANMHMPEKWGYLEFRKSPVPYEQMIPPVPFDPEWPVRFMAFELYYAQKAFYAIHGHFASTIDNLTSLIKDQSFLHCFLLVDMKVR